MEGHKASKTQLELKITVYKKECQVRECATPGSTGAQMCFQLRGGGVCTRGVCTVCDTCTKDLV